MNIYCIHSTAFDFVADYYLEITQCSLLKEHEMIFPHLPGSPEIHSRSIIDKCDLVLAEVSYPSTGLGIELGWADSAGKPIVAVHKKDLIISSSIRMITQHIVPYSSMRDIGEFIVSKWSQS
jgi:hypothetical protein